MIKVEDKIFHLLADKFTPAALLWVSLLRKSEIFIHLCHRFAVTIEFEDVQMAKPPRNYFKD